MTTTPRTNPALNIKLGPDPTQWPEPFKSRYVERLRLARLPDYSKFRPDPHGYARDVLKVRLTPDQNTMLSSIRDNRYTEVLASHAIGKTFTAAVAASWWYDCWLQHICYITAPSWGQALGLTFKQLKTMRRELQLPGNILDTGWVKDPDRVKEGAHYVQALNAETGEGFQGEHSAPILIIMEEGVGVPRYIWEAAKGLMTHPDCRMFVIGNPTDEATEFGQAASSDKFHVLSISALDHPNIKAELNVEPPPFPDAVRLLWVYEQLKDECDVVESLVEDAFEWYSLEQVQRALNGQPAEYEPCYYMPTASFQGRVLGQFPTQADQQVIPRTWLKFQPVQKPKGMPEIGCDIARFGDDRTTIFLRQGPCVLNARELRKMDNAEVESALRDMANEAAIAAGAGANPKRIKIKIDITGGLGTGPHDNLKRDGYTVVGINSSERADDSEQYKNRRSELWFQMRLRARDKRLDLSRLRKDIRERLEKELSAPKYKSPGQKIVEDKAQMKSRLGYSPDLADGNNLAFYEGGEPAKIITW